MEHPSTDTMNLALDVFDRHGRLKEEYLHHPVRRGLGIWQTELSEGNFLIIETVTVLRKARRRGIGRRLVMDMIQKAVGMDDDVRFVFAYPTCLHRGEDLEERKGKTKRERFDMADAQKAIAIRFFRKLGFRRIGISHWFAFSIDANHRSRNISIDEDPDPLEAESFLDGNYDSDDSQPEVPKTRSVMVGPPLGADGNFDFGEVGSSDHHVEEFYEEKERRRQERSEYAQRYPIHQALQSLSDVQCLALLKDRNLEIDGSQGCLFEMRDGLRNNILHIAACQSKPECVAWILDSMTLSNSNLKEGRNIEGYTPLEALQAQLEVTRLGKYLGQRFLVQADKFDGFPDEAVRCMLALRGCPTQDNSPYWACTRFGCNCGFCLRGFLSHRMRQTLQDIAEELLYRLKTTETSDNRLWCMVNGDLLEYIPENIRSIFKKSRVLRRGFKEFITTIIECLQAGGCPASDDLLSLYKKKRIWPQMHTFYFSRGGSIEAALNLILDLAGERFEDIFDPRERDYEPLPALPRCRNDSEFELVRRQCTTVPCDDQGKDSSINARFS
jgi:GNAT superfamily N-acetyltransferase